MERVVVVAAQVERVRVQVVVVVGRSRRKRKLKNNYGLKTMCCYSEGGKERERVNKGDFVCNVVVDYCDTFTIVAVNNGRECDTCNRISFISVSRGEVPTYSIDEERDDDDDGRLGLTTRVGLD